MQLFHGIPLHPQYDTETKYSQTNHRKTNNDNEAINTTFSSSRYITLHSHSNHHYKHYIVTRQSSHTNILYIDTGQSLHTYTLSASYSSPHVPPSLVLTLASSTPSLACTLVVYRLGRWITHYYGQKTRITYSQKVATRRFKRYSAGLPRGLSLRLRVGQNNLRP